MWDAVKQGWLSDVKGKRVITNTSLDSVKTTAGDFNQKQLESTVNTSERNSLIVKTWWEHAKKEPQKGWCGLHYPVMLQGHGCGVLPCCVLPKGHTGTSHKTADEFGPLTWAYEEESPASPASPADSYRRTVGFCADIQHAKDLAQAFTDAGVRAKAVWGVDPERKQKLKDHADGCFPVLCNAQMLTEGYDDPSIECIVMAKPTKSPAAYTQRIGRGTRLQEGISNLVEAKKQGIELTKQDCLILDFVDVTQKHKLITTASLIGLPTELDLKGKSALQVKTQIEELQAQYPEADLGRLKDLDQISGQVIDVDLWKVEFAEEVKKESAMQWHKQDEGRYFLYITQTDFATVYVDMLEKWHAVIRVGTNNIVEQFDNRRETFKFAERMVNLCNADRARYLQRTASWGRKPANKFQREYLQRLGVPMKDGLTWNEANQLINRFRAARATQTAALTGAPHEL